MSPRAKTTGPSFPWSAVTCHRFHRSRLCRMRSASLAISPLPRANTLDQQVLACLPVAPTVSIKTVCISGCISNLQSDESPIHLSRPVRRTWTPTLRVDVSSVCHSVSTRLAGFGQRRPLFSVMRLVQGSETMELISRFLGLDLCEARGVNTGQLYPNLFGYENGVLSRPTQAGYLRRITPLRGARRSQRAIVPTHYYLHCSARY